MSHVILPLIRKQEILISRAVQAATRSKTLQYTTSENQTKYVMGKFVHLPTITKTAKKKSSTIFNLFWQMIV